MLGESEDFNVEWRVRAIRGATTAAENSVEAIRDVVSEMLDELEHRNHLEPDRIISATFSVTQDLDAIFPASIARKRPQWDHVALLDVQQMKVIGDLERCIRLLLYVQLPYPHEDIYHPYLQQAKNLRPDLSFAPQTLSSN